MNLSRALVRFALVLASTAVVACAAASATPGTPITAPPASPTSVIGPPTLAPTILPASTPTDAGATDTSTPPSGPTPAATLPARDGTPQPSPGGPTPSVATGAPGGTVRVTQADNGQTITLRVGQTFLLALGSNLDWNITVADPTVVSRVVNVAVVRGAQGIYRANQAGQTTLTATGRPICAPNQACPMFIQLVKVNLVVR
ncbi:MAG: hypothetical protein ACRDIY_10505 [Chloroflexota bacterium]